MKKRLLLIAALFILCCTACGNEVPGLENVENTSDNGGNTSSNASFSIVTTIFPEYDWVREVLGDRMGDADVMLLADNGVDMHSYQPTVDDIVKISGCDVFVYVGGESDKWVDDIIQNADNKNMTAINLLDVLGDRVKEEEVVEGMEEEKEGEEDESEYDEHVWLSLKNTQLFCEEIAKALGQVDKANADIYKANADAYIAKLTELDTKYKETIDNAKTKTLLFGDRFPFRYMVDDYGLDYYAAFAGCSAETEASFETVTFLAGKVDELELRAVMTIEGSDGTIAKTIINNTKGKDQKILELNSMQSVTAKDIENGERYIDIMDKNLEVIKEAVSE